VGWIEGLVDWIENGEIRYRHLAFWIVGFLTMAGICAGVLIGGSGENGCIGLSIGFAMLFGAFVGGFGFAMACDLGWYL